MQSNKLIILVLLSATALISFSNFVQAYHRGSHHAVDKVSKPCCTTAKMRFARCDESYSAGCRAAKTYVEGNIGSHSKAWNEGFTDCRYNVYRSEATEKQAEKTICGYSHCYR